MPSSSASSTSTWPCEKRRQSRLRANITAGGSNVWAAKIESSKPSPDIASGITCASAAGVNRSARQRSPMRPGKLRRYGRSAEMSSAWLGVAIACWRGPSCLANTPASGNASTLSSEVSISPHSLDVGRTSM